MNKARLDAIEQNVAWLQDADLEDEEDRIEAAKRLGLIQGDAKALVSQLSGVST